MCQAIKKLKRFKLHWRCSSGQEIFTLWCLSRTPVPEYCETRDTRNPHKHPGRQLKPTSFVIGPVLQKRPRNGHQAGNISNCLNSQVILQTPHSSRLDNKSWYAGRPASQQASCEVSQRHATNSHATFAPRKKPLPSVSTAGGVTATSSTVTVGAFLSSST